MSDGKKRPTKKSALKDILLKPAVCVTPLKLQNTSKTAMVIDMIGLLRTLISLQDTNRNLAELFIKSLPQGYKRTDIVADCYCSVKLPKNRVDDEYSEKILIPSISARAHPQFKTIVMASGENKARLIKLIFENIKEGSRRCLEILDTTMIIHSTESGCVKEVQREDQDTISAYPELTFKHEEGEKKSFSTPFKFLRRMWMLLSLFALPLATQV